MGNSFARKLSAVSMICCCSCVGSKSIIGSNPA
jgi:hypothetical protein